LYGLAVGGERGVAMIIELLRDELARTLELMGRRSIAEIDRSCLRIDRELELL
jgi:isopentenyl diphosphate isomerase/L-lactate dehydrogenase-like FMN-dependent dehydrogenase